jgi:hypothetical protein
MGHMCSFKRTKPKPHTPTNHTSHRSTHPTPATTTSRSIGRWINIPRTITSKYHIIPVDNRRNPASIRSYGYM